MWPSLIFYSKLQGWDVAVLLLNQRLWFWQAKEKLSLITLRSHTTKLLSMQTTWIEIGKAEILTTSCQN